eukprot:9097600-Alexandrium_andersonii.AAC.1
MSGALGNRGAPGTTAVLWGNCSGLPWNHGMSRPSARWRSHRRSAPPPPASASQWQARKPKRARTRCYG